MTPRRANFDTRAIILRNLEETHKDAVMCLQYKSFENIVGKGEIAHNEQFLLFSQCFPRFRRAFCLL